MQAFDISDRDAPVETSQLDVARNVTTVRVLGDHLLRFGSDWATNQTILDMTPVDQASVAEPQAEIDLSALFGEDTDPTGEQIRIRNQIFKVLGVMAPRGASTSGQNQDDQILAPYTTVIKKLQGNDRLNYILASARSGDRMQPAADQITVALMAAHGIEAGEEPDFRVQTQDDLVAARTETSRTLTSLLAGIAGVSLVVGGIGIMNIMLVSVTERTREIGIRLAIGAQARDVLLQFLIEAATLSSLGGVVGIALGLLGGAVATDLIGLPFVIDPLIIVVAFLFSAAVGVVFGFFPARRAARLDPIEALRHE